MRTKETMRQSNALDYARRWAKIGQWKHFKKRVQEAMTYKPLSEMQVFNLKQVAGLERTKWALTPSQEGKS